MRKEEGRREGRKNKPLGGERKKIEKEDRRVIWTEKKIEKKKKER